MKEADSPMQLWDYCLERRARINNLTATPLFSLHGQTPHFSVTAEEGDISNFFSLSGMTGATSETRKVDSHITRKSWAKS